MALDFTNLQAWTDESGDLLPEAILSTETLSHIAVQTGIAAGTVSLNVFNAEFADAARACGWNPDGDITFDQVDVTVSDRQIKQEMCVNTARQYYLAQRMKPGAAGAEELPFEQVIADYYLTGVQKNIEDFIGTQIKTEINATDANLQPGTPAALTVSNAIDQLNDLYDALDPAIQMRDDVKIIMSPEAYRTAVRAFVAADLMHYNFGQGEGDVYLPGTNALLIKNSGLVGSDYRAAFSGQNVVFATGLLDDMDKFNLFYDQAADNVKATVYYRRGLGVYDVAKQATNGLA